MGTAPAEAFHALACCTKAWINPCRNGFQKIRWRDVRDTVIPKTNAQREHILAWFSFDFMRWMCYYRKGVEDLLGRIYSKYFGKGKIKWVLMTTLNK